MVTFLCGLPGCEIHVRPWQNTPEWYQSPYCVDGEEYVRSYRDLLSRSVFTLCPRGYGLTSFRLYEAIQAGSIPIYISDEFWLPFRNELEWSEFALIVHEDDVADVPRLIGGMSASVVRRMQQNLADVSATHFNLESTCERIVAAVNDLPLVALDDTAASPKEASPALTALQESVA